MGVLEIARPAPLLLNIHKRKSGVVKVGVAGTEILPNIVSLYTSPTFPSFIAKEVLPLTVPIIDAAFLSLFNDTAVELNLRKLYKVES